MRGQKDDRTKKKKKNVKHDARCFGCCVCVRRMAFMNSLRTCTGKAVWIGCVARKKVLSFEVLGVLEHKEE
jgi:hypothetical protein